VVGLSRLVVLSPLDYVTGIVDQRFKLIKDFLYQPVTITIIAVI
jgi:hypothetical protein